MSVTSVSPQRLQDAANSGEEIDLIDVRTPVEFEEVHVPFARNISLDRLDPAKVAEQRKGDQKPLYVICRSGGRGKQACEKLEAAGHANVFNVEGGTQAWEQAGLPVARGQKMVSLERQVRIAAGSLVFAGVVLGFFVHPYWLAIPAFVGAGLVFSGVTDTCGMGLMLARMPWNRASKPSAPSSEANSSCCTR